MPTPLNLDCEFLTTPQVMALLGVNRPRVGVIARRLGWRSVDIPSRRNIKAKRYLAADVLAELERRKNEVSHS
jgi:hypothetical protein